MNYNCQECNHELKCMVVIGADQSYSGKTERLYLCEQCLSTWSVTTDENGYCEIRRYFFG